MENEGEFLDSLHFPSFSERLLAPPPHPLYCNIHLHHIAVLESDDGVRLKRAVVADHIIERDTGGEGHAWGGRDCETLVYMVRAPHTYIPKMTCALSSRPYTQTVHVGICNCMYDACRYYYIWRQKRNQTETRAHAGMRV